MANLNIKRPLQIDDAVRERAKELQEYAFVHRQTTPMVINYVAQANPPPPALQHHVMEIPNGYEVVYSIEQRPGRGWCQFIAVSMTTPRLMPSPVAVTEILKLFGVEQKVKTQGGILRDAIDMQEAQMPNYRMAITLLYPFDFALWQKTHPTPQSSNVS